MEIVTIRKEGLLCSVCLKELKEDEEAFKFFNKINYQKETLRDGHIKVANGQIHFRHLVCQYNTKPRKIPFEEWIKKVKFDLDKRKLKLKILGKKGG